MEDNVSKIKDRLDVVDVIGSYIKTHKAGINYKARCPFHNEKTPSFYISPERQIWHCFGCAKGGDMFSFVQDIEGVEFPEALRILAQKAGVEIEKFDTKVKDEKASLYDACELAAKFFEKQLRHSVTGKKALTYLKDRGLKMETVDEFRLGFAPDDWRSLSDFLSEKGFNRSDIIDSGLAIKKDSGDIYDRFRSRIMFPICDINDRVVGFTARVFGDNHPADVGKYINTPQTKIYDKSRILYGLNKAKIDTRRNDRCLLVEGNIDAIMSYQAGVKNVVASSGTALTQSHLQLLQRYTKNLDFCFDSDQAGSLATRRGVGMALSQNFDVKVVHIKDPSCKDPADYIKKFGSGWGELNKQAKPVIEFYFDKSKSDLDLSSVQGKKSIIAILGPFIQRLTSNVEHAHWVGKLATLLKTKEEAVEADIKTAKDDLAVYEDRHSAEQGPIVVKPVDRLPTDMLSGALLAVILKDPSLFKEEIAKIDTELLDPFVAEAIKKITALGKKKFDFASFAANFEKPEAMNIEFANLRAQELLKDFTDEELRSEFISITGRIGRKSMTAQLSEIEFEIRQAEEAKDSKKLSNLLTKFSTLRKKLNNN